ncbi:UNVERIFIED_CONTAM: hypothetical protein Sindi_0685500 [Sesamum indicum]
MDELSAYVRRWSANGVRRQHLAYRILPQRLCAEMVCGSAPCLWHTSTALMCGEGWQMVCGNSTLRLASFRITYVGRRLANGVWRQHLVCGILAHMYIRLNPICGIPREIDSCAHE